MPINQARKTLNLNFIAMGKRLSNQVLQSMKGIVRLTFEILLLETEQ